MLPGFVTVSDFRTHLSTYLNEVSLRPIVIKGKKSQAILLDEKEYNKLTALAEQFLIEDPEGEYRPEFIEEMRKIRKKKDDIDHTITSLQSLNDSKN